MISGVCKLVSPILFYVPKIQLVYEVFVYQPNREVYYVFDFKDTIKVHRKQKPITYKEKTASGIIYSSISETLDDQGLSPVLAFQMSDICLGQLVLLSYKEGDRFKVIYEDKYIDDSIYVGFIKLRQPILSIKSPFMHLNTKQIKKKELLIILVKMQKTLEELF